MEPEWVTKQDLYICGLKETHNSLKDTQRLKIKIFNENGNKQENLG